MALKDDWIDLKDATETKEGDEIRVEPINNIAHAVIALEKTFANIKNADEVEY